MLSCRENDEVDELDSHFAYVAEVCEIKSDIKAPEGYEIEALGGIDFFGSIRGFQFVDGVGYALGQNSDGGYVDVFKTIDKGRSWSNLNVNIPQHPINMIFRDERYGLISLHDVTGCPPPTCQNKCVVLKTTDGGVSWEEIEYKELKGVLYHLTYDEEATLYAILSLEDRATLMVSRNDGVSWDTLYSSPKLDLSLVTFSFKLFRDKIYINGKGATIVVIDKLGNLIKTIRTREAVIWDLEIIDENTLVVVHSGQVIKSNDDGASWQVIYDESARMIGFETEEKGLMMLEKNSCPTDIYQVNDLIATTQDGGLTWIEADKVTTNLRVSYSNSQKIEDDSYLLMIGNQLFRIAEASPERQSGS